MTSPRIQLFVDDGIMKEWSGGSFNPIPDTLISNDAWYHLIIEFDCDTDTYDLYLNGTQKLDDKGFNSGATTLSYIDFRTGGGDSGYTFHIDGLDFSWRSGYSEGDNINPYGLLTDLEDDGWTFDIPVFIAVGITGEYNEHIKSLQIEDNSNSKYVLISKTFSDKTTGTVEFYIKTTDNSRIFNAPICDGGVNHAVSFRIDAGKFQYRDVGGWNDITVVSNDVWYHIIIEFDCVDDWHLWINGTSMDGGSGYDFYGSPTAMDTFYFQTNTSEYTYTVNIDALSFSWEDDLNASLTLLSEELLDVYAYINKYIDFSFLNRYD